MRCGTFFLLEKSVVDRPHTRHERFLSKRFLWKRERAAKRHAEESRHTQAWKKCFGGLFAERGFGQSAATQSTPPARHFNLPSQIFGFGLFLFLCISTKAYVAPEKVTRTFHSAQMAKAYQRLVAPAGVAGCRVAGALSDSHCETAGLACFGMTPSLRCAAKENR